MYYNVHMPQTITPIAPEALPARVCYLVLSRPDISNATARIAMWLAGACASDRATSIELSRRQVSQGFVRDGEKFAGTGCRDETVKASLEWLEAAGVITSTEGRSVGFGHQSRVYTFLGEQ